MKRLSTLLGTLVVSSSLWAADIEIQTPYARAVPPGQPNSAAFMQLINRGQEAVALIGARSEASRVVELHTHTQEQGVMRMRQIKRIELPAGERVDLQPGGLHLMLIGLQAPLSEGQQLEMTLEFSDGSEQQLQVPVQRVMPRSMKGHH